jgi:hypothetical protein
MNINVSSCTPHEPGGPPACRYGGHCVVNTSEGLKRRPTCKDMLALVASIASQDESQLFTQQHLR